MDAGEADRRRWEIQHEFDSSPARPIDYEVYHHYVSTHPKSRSRLVVMSGLDVER